MCKSLVWRGFFVGALFLLFTAGVASSQMSPFPPQNTIAWGGPVQPPDVGSADNRPQTPMPTPVQVDASAESSSDTPAETGSDQPAGQAGNVNNSTASTTSDNNTVRQLGTPFPLRLQAEGLKIGPFYVPTISDQFFFATNSVPGQPTQNLVGNSITANLVASKTFSRGILAFQAKEQVSLANSSHPFINQTVGLTFTDQLSERWSLSANAEFTYFQNSIFANPQYFLSYQSSGVVQQTLFVQQQSYTIYESNNISLNYALSGRTQITLSPIIGATFLQQPVGGWTSTHQLGGSVGLTRQFTPDVSLGAYYTLTRSITSGVSGAPSYNSQSFGVSFQYRFLQSWSIGGTLSATGQALGNTWGLTPTGSLRVTKGFNRSSSISAGYTRTEANTVFVSSGYYDQGDIAYNQAIGRKLNFNVGVGQFRTINTGSHFYGKRVGGSISYQWSPRLSLTAGYNFSHQEGVQASNFSPFLGNTNSINVGLTWILGSRSGL